MTASPDALDAMAAEPKQGVSDATYGADFFDGIADGSRRSAEIVVPLLIELFSPRSVVDIGGGPGYWAAAFAARGVEDVMVVDGAWVPETARAVPTRFMEHDLASPLALDRTFDLALSLEAAEHLPASAAADFVRALTDSAPLVVFSAAQPGQGGDGHINEQPSSYWVKLFADRDYACFNDLRRRIWNDDRVEVWYRQNLLCFARRSELKRWRKVLNAPVDETDPLLDVAHPEFLARHKSSQDKLRASSRNWESSAKNWEATARDWEASAHYFEASVHRCEADIKLHEADSQNLRQEILRLQERSDRLDRITRSRSWRALQFLLRLIPRARHKSRPSV